MHAHSSLSVPIGEIRDIRPLCWCPGVIVSRSYFAFHIFYKQPQRIRPIWNILQCDLCVLAKMSGMEVNRDEAPHGLDTSLDSGSVRMYAALSSRRGCSQVLFLGIFRLHVYSITLKLQRGVGATCLTTVRRASGTNVVALCMHGTMNKLNIILIFLVYKRRFSQH